MILAKTISSTDISSSQQLYTSTVQSASTSTVTTYPPYDSSIMTMSVYLKMAYDSYGNPGTYTKVSSPTSLSVGGLSSGLSLNKSVISWNNSSIEIESGWQVKSATLALYRTGSYTGSTMTAASKSYSFTSSPVYIDVTSLMSSSTATVTLEATSGNFVSFTMAPELTVVVEEIPPQVPPTASSSVLASSISKSTDSTLVTGECGACNYSLNPRTSALTITKSLESLGGLKMPLDLSMSYNPDMDTSNSITSSISTYMPYGWKLNYQQYIVSDGADYLYIDGNYNIYKFVQAEGSSTIFYESSGSGLVLEATIYGITITDGVNTELTFEDGLLKQIKQMYSDTEEFHMTTTLSYSGYKLSTITDGIGRTATLTYTSNMLSSISVNGSIEFTVTDNKLVSVQDANNVISTYAYNSGITCTDTEGCALQFSISSGICSQLSYTNGDSSSTTTLTTGTNYSDVTAEVKQNNVAISNTTQRYYFDAFSRCMGTQEIKDGTAVDWYPTNSGNLNIMQISESSTAYGCFNQATTGTSDPKIGEIDNQDYYCIPYPISISCTGTAISGAYFTVADGVSYQQARAKGKYYLWYNNRCNMVVLSSNYAVTLSHSSGQSCTLASVVFGNFTVTSNYSAGTNYTIGSGKTVVQATDGITASTTQLDSYNQTLSVASNGVTNIYEYNDYGSISTESIQPDDGSSTQTKQYTYTIDTGDSDVSMYSATTTSTFGESHGAFLTDITTYGEQESTTSYSFRNSTGNIQYVKDPLGNSQIYSFTNNRLAQLYKKADSTYNINNITYTNNMVDTLAHNSTTYQYSYNGNRVSGVSVSGSTLADYTYGATSIDGVSRYTATNNITGVSSIYDSYGRLIQLRDGDTVMSSYSYSADNSSGKLSQVIDNIAAEEYNYIYTDDDIISRIDIYSMSTSSNGTVQRTFKGSIANSYYDEGRLSTTDNTGRTDQRMYIAYEYATANALDTTVDSSATYIGEDTEGSGWVSRQSYDDYNRVSNIQQCHYLEASVHEADIQYDNIGKPISYTRKIPTIGTSYNTDTDTISYDACGNISSISNSNGTVSYTYDEIGRLTRENNQALGATYIYSYNAGGNITSKQTCSYSTATSPTVVSEIVYTYNNSWTDQLTSWGSSTHPLTMQYDSHGNATKYKYSELDDTDSSTVQYTRGLMTQLGGYSFGYNASGVRTSKTKSSLYNYQYIVDGTNLLQEVYTSDSTTRTIQYAYTHHGLVGFLYNGNRYYYMRNVLGDIVAICDQSGDKLATYTYDAWGNHTVCDGSGTDVSEDDAHIANINPFRYRGYYYDTDLDLYYLQSRYYDPNTGRFINADTIDYLDPESINGLNLYAYCLNNPIMYCDPTGHDFWDVFKWVAVGISAVVAVGLIVAGTILSGGALGAVLLGAGIGGLVGGAIGGSVASINGTDIASGIIGGAMTGAALGAASPLASFGGVGFGIMAGTTFGAGTLSYTVETLGNGKQFNAGHMFGQAFTTLAAGSAMFGFSSMLGMAGKLNGFEGFVQKYLAKQFGVGSAFGIFAIYDMLMGTSTTPLGNLLDYLGLWF